VRLSYSKAPLLEYLEVHHFDEKASVSTGDSPLRSAEPGGKRARDEAVPIPIGSEGADLRGYEWLVDIEPVESKVLHWPWKEVNPHLGDVYEMDVKYTGRHLYLLYNPVTGRLMGTTPFHFATMAKFPVGKIDRPHRHTSASINYYLWGHGKSTVGGQRVEWEAGDLQFSAPGWEIHNHGSREQGFVALTIQDHPLHLAMDSLLWQEELKGPIQHLGSTHGFETNLSKVAG
jgi:gentisate 1,2-dioxygenase